MTLLAICWTSQPTWNRDKITVVKQSPEIWARQLNLFSFLAPSYSSSPVHIVHTFEDQQLGSRWQHTSWDVRLWRWQETDGTSEHQNITNPFSPITFSTTWWCVSWLTFGLWQRQKLGLNMVKQLQRKNRMPSDTSTRRFAFGPPSSPKITRAQTVACQGRPTPGKDQKLQQKNCLVGHS